jgi:hypothetical protein
LAHRRRRDRAVRQIRQRVRRSRHHRRRHRSDHGLHMQEEAKMRRNHPHRICRVCPGPCRADPCQNSCRIIHFQCRPGSFAQEQGGRDPRCSTRAMPAEGGFQQIAAPADTWKICYKPTPFKPIPPVLYQQTCFRPCVGSPPWCANVATAHSKKPRPARTFHRFSYRKSYTMANNKSVRPSLCRAKTPF